MILEKICRNIGEDEYDSIVDLKNEAKIQITNKEAIELRGRQIWIWIIEPLKKSNRLEEARFKFLKIDLPSFLYVKKFEKNGKIYIKYPLGVNIFDVHDDIFEVMREEYGIKDNYLNCNEWEYVQSTNLWKKAEIQVAREIIADSLINKCKILD